MPNPAASYLLTHSLTLHLAIGVLSVSGAIALVKTTQYLTAAYKGYLANVEAMRPTGRLSTYNVR